VACLDLKKIIEETIIDVIINEIVDEVIYRIENSPKKALVIFTGGSLGFNKSIKELKELKQNGWQLKVLLSKSAEEIYTKEGLKNILAWDDVKIYSENDIYDIRDCCKDVDKVIIPVLTINTAAKVALSIRDNLITNIVAHCLMTGIPIVAAKNACDPMDEEREKIGMGKSNSYYKNVQNNYLITLESYGIKLVSADNLYKAVLGKKKNKIQEQSKTIKNIIMHNKKLLTKSDIIAASHFNKDLKILAGTIVTPSAKDAARTMGVKIII
jgi:hypothetical protein